MRTLGSAALNISMVAMGGADANYEFGIHAWDVAAGQLLVEEAGGVCIDPSGNCVIFAVEWLVLDDFTESVISQEVHSTFCLEEFCAPAVWSWLKSWLRIFLNITLPEIRIIKM